ncbi:hemerythrin domain-containing protein [Shewanella eurypsychrophilus]|uniref:Hemerythrin domain-containing protein n=2 Tax=Shewanellaceae TaxID=267890 RepID=A0ABX6V350_9GAMM|nr:hemerythrin [Shewanella sp. YLB-09]QPG57056.1 hemerythrin domain-containing protein [Shewanella eurypsychrophilus]
METTMLARLNHDHKHIAILLKILKVKQSRLAQGEAVNFNLIRDIVEYMQSYAEHSHHPLEDIIYSYYLKKTAQSETDDKLATQHQTLVDASASLMASLNLILSDVVISKDQLVLDLKSYVTQQEEHMRYEETEVFPLWAEVIGQTDWQEIQALCTLKLIDDPLFSDNDNVVFEELRDYITKDE